MTKRDRKCVAIVYPGDQDALRTATGENSRFTGLFRAFAGAGVEAVPAVYHDDFCHEVREQLRHVDGALVWVNPIENGRSRSMLDNMLREVAASGVFVSTHPDIILKLGTKRVLYETRNVGWGCDTRLYETWEQIHRELPVRLGDGFARVLKQYRGSGGNGVWKVQLGDSGGVVARDPGDIPVLVRHAQRGCREERITLGEFIARCRPYFADGAPMIEQQYQDRLAEGMVRCYLVHDRVAGFGHQAINALYPAPKDRPGEAPQPGPRLYYPPDKPEFQAVKSKLEQEWVPAVQRLLGIPTDQLPVLWDCDFLLGPKDEDGQDTYVLCEINVSSVSPYPESAAPRIVEATMARISGTT